MLNQFSRTQLLLGPEAMEKLKNAVEENEFLLDVGSVDLNALLSNQKGLAAFLNKSLKTKEEKFWLSIGSKDQIATIKKKLRSMSC